jgi:hypothetical protein
MLSPEAEGHNPIRPFEEHLLHSGGPIFIRKDTFSVNVCVPHTSMTPTRVDGYKAEIKSITGRVSLKELIK